jgi:hypothetical protein
MQKAGTGPHVLTSLRNAGHCDKLPIQRSPWVLPVTPSNQRRKLEYCERQMVLTRGRIMFADKDNHSSIVLELVNWRKRIEWIKANKL